MVDTPVSNSVLEEIIEKSKISTGMYIQRIYKESLRTFINIFGNIYYLDANNNPIKITCFHANPERAISKITAGNNITLPVITISETSTSNSDERRRYGPILVHEKYWDKRQNRAVRVLSLAPRPVNIMYQINIWAKHKQDLDQIRENIFFIFNPDLEINSKFSTITKAFLTGESEASQIEAPDTQDRILKKNIQVTLETYLPGPKFLYTNTGMIEEFKYEVEIENYSDIVTDTEILLN